MINFQQWYELARLTRKGDKGMEIAEELFRKLFPNLHYYYIGRKRYLFQEGNCSLYCMGMLYSSGLVDIPGKYITTLSFPATGVDFQVNEISVPGIPIIRTATDAFFDTNDTGENGEIMANGHIRG